MEKPSWPLTSYGPAKCDPTLVTELDESAEELRVKGAEAFKAGSMNDYVRLSFSLLFIWDNLT